jgi:hypothetical protein
MGQEGKLSALARNAVIPPTKEIGGHKERNHVEFTNVIKACGRGSFHRSSLEEAAA